MNFAPKPSVILTFLLVLEFSGGAILGQHCVPSFSPPALAFTICFAPSFPAAEYGPGSGPQAVTFTWSCPGAGGPCGYPESIGFFNLVPDSTPSGLWPSQISVGIRNWMAGDPNTREFEVRWLPTATGPLDPGVYSCTLQYTTWQFQSCNGIPFPWNNTVLGTIPVSLTVMGPRITTQPTSQMIPFGSGFSLSVIAEGGTSPNGGDLEYTWFHDGQPVSCNATCGPTFAINQPDCSAAGSWFVRVSLSNCSGYVDSLPAIVSFFGPPLIAAHPQSRVVAVGSPVEFSVMPTALSPDPPHLPMPFPPWWVLQSCTYQWRRNGLDIPGATDLTYSIPATRLSDTGSYDVIVTSCSGSTQSSPATLDVVNLSMEIVDAAHPVFFAAGSGVTTDEGLLAMGGDPRIGVVADGVATLILRTVSDIPGSVTFEILNATPALSDGSLRSASGTQSGATVATTTQPIGADHRAVVLLTAPMDFVRGPQDTNLGCRNVTIRATLTTPGGSPVAIDRIMEVRRPPVVLSHGLWSSLSTWVEFAPLTVDSRFEVTLADYRWRSAREFAANRRVVRTWSDQARRKMAACQIACAQVDWIGHSMGGLLPRVAFKEGDYFRGENLLRGDIHKLVSLNSPHWGSPLATMLSLVQATPIVGTRVAGILRDILPIDQGAIRDLAEGSDALREMGSTSIPTHTVSGDGGSLLLGAANATFELAAVAAPRPYSTIFEILNILGETATTVIYRDDDHDFVVIEDSQRGGLAGATTSELTGPMTHHRAVTGNSTYSNLVIDLLNASVGSGRFAPTIPPTNPHPWLPTDGGTPALAPGTIALSLTAPIGPVIAGQFMSVMAVPTPGLLPHRVTFFWPDGSWSESNTSPFECSWLVPAHFVGPTKVEAIARTQVGEIAFADSPLRVAVTTTAQLTNLAVYPAEFWATSAGEDPSLHAMGSYGDRVSRDLTSAATGTSWASSDPSVVSVDGEGQLTPHQTGVATVSASHGPFTATATVHVEFAPVAYYGRGLCGTGGIIPTLRAVGAPGIGNSRFRIEAVDVVGGAAGILGASTASAATPLFGGDGTLLLDLSQPSLLTPIAANGNSGVSGVGRAIVSLPIPLEPSLIGVTVYIQCGFLDVGSRHGWSLTNGLQLIVSP